mmetsp:Transcript_40607/g.72745  ORF Transcript_40607/g.72745 Transcript_40607/m.72745 type:complete len:83 (+) Transcript_40607:42-290(+)
MATDIPLDDSPCSKLGDLQVLVTPALSAQEGDSLPRVQLVSPRQEVQNVEDDLEARVRQIDATMSGCYCAWFIAMFRPCAGH